MKRITSLLLAVIMMFGVITPSGITANAAENYPLNSIVIKIEDIVTHTMLGGARFEIYYSNDALSGGYGTLVATVDTDGSGVIVLSGIPSGYYIVRQTVPPNNYHLSINNEQHCYIKPDGTSIEELVFSNYRYGGLLVYLSDKDTGAPVGGATFSVTDVNGKTVGNSADGVYTTDRCGEFYLENLPADDYKITQLTAAQGYAMDGDSNMRTVRLQHTSADQSVYRAAFSNSPLGTLLVRLKDNVSKEPLACGVFNVKLSGGAELGEFTTGAEGTFTLPKIARGTYIITQVSAPAGYLLANTAKTQYVNYVSTYAVDFTNSPKSGLYVTKYDAYTKAPLKDATFKVWQDSTLIGSYTTNAEGVFFIPNLAPGWYTVAEYASPQGYVLDDAPKSVQVISEQLHRLEFENSKKASLQIVKTDEFSAEPLSGAKFRITKQNGEFVADVTTDNSGKAYIAELEPGWYVISETKAPLGYTASEAARTVEVKSTVPTVVTITNRAENNLQIVKLDYFSRVPLQGATFRVERSNGTFIGTFRTDAAGKILVGNLKEDTYVISEIAAPDGYQLDSEPQVVALSGGLMRSVEFLDKPLSGIEILKTDEFSHAPLTGATFTVERDNGEKVGTYKTDTSGKIIVSDLADGTYIVSETIAPSGYIRDVQPQTAVVKSGKLTSLEFTNKPLSGIEILKTDSKTNAPLSGAVFTIECVNGERIGKYTTDIAGKILVSDLAEGVYIISEITAPDGYVLDSAPKMVEVKSGKLSVAEFTNKSYPILYIKKIDANTGALVAGAQFAVANQNGEVVANVASLATGAVAVRVAPGVYTITEVQAPNGYELNDPIQTVEVRADGSTVYYGGSCAGTALTGNTATFANRKLNTLEIVKLDSVTKNPLSGAMFDVTKANGEKIGSYPTDASGKILIPELSEGTYVISETAAPQGYILSESPKSVNISGGKLVSVEFLNKPLAGIQIVKLDSVTHNPLQGAKFSVTKANGEVIGNFTTEADGKVPISGLDEDVYVVGEVTAPDGYIIDSAPQTVIVKSGKLTAVEFTNKPIAGLQIIKLNSETRQPIANTEFIVSRMSGERVGTFKTDKAGTIYVSTLEPGWYVVTETKAADGYIIDSEPKNVEIKTGKSTTLEVLNTQQSGLLIVKTDEAAGKPLQGVVFDVKRADGQFVAGAILDGNQTNTKANSPNKSTAPNGDISGSYTTDANGRIQINGLPAGEYHVTERKQLDGYELDTEVHSVTVTPGKLATLQLTNRQKAGLRLLKIDSATKKGIYNVEFMVFDSNNKVVGNYVTDNNGVIDFDGILEPGRYSIRETRPALGYYNDDMPRTVEFKSGKVTEVVWENTPQMGQIQITKLSGDDNEVNGLPKGTPLSGAVFEIYNYKSGNLVDRFVSGTDGRAVSKPLPIGRYTVREVQAPEWYRLSTEAMDIEVEFATQIIKREFLNYSANTGVKIKKVGNYEAMSGDTIKYEFKEIQNTSTVPLTDFYWRDIVPTDAVRLNKIVTGTYNQSLKYKILITTNKGDTKVIADNLSTTQNNVIDCRNAALGLRSDEYVTGFTLVFGTVKAGFCKVETPSTYMTVLPNLPNGYEFGNKSDIGGKYGSEWVVGASSWVTKCYAKNVKLPRTGY